LQSLGRLNLLSSVARLQRDLRFLFLALFLWTFGLGLYNYVWPVYLRQLSASPDNIGLAYSVGYVAFAASMIPGAILSNRYDLRKVLIASWAFSIPTPIIYLIATSWQEATIGLVLLQLTSFGIPAFNAFIVANSEPDRVSSSFGSTASAAPLGMVLSPLLGSLMLQWTGLNGIFLLSFGLFSISTIVLLPIKKYPGKKDDFKIRLEIPKSLVEVFLLGFIATSALAFSLVSSFLPLYYQDAFLLKPALIQLIGAVQSGGAAIFAVLIGKRAEAHGQRNAMTAGVLLAASGLFGVVLGGSVLVAVPMIFLFGAARSPTYVAYSLLSKRRPGASRAGTFGFYLTIESVGLIVGSYLGGLIYGVSPADLVLSGASIFVLLAIFSWLRLGPLDLTSGETSKTT
jgi:MFS family permease